MNMLRLFAAVLLITLSLFPALTVLVNQCFPQFDSVTVAGLQPLCKHYIDYPISMGYFSFSTIQIYYY